MKIVFVNGAIPIELRDYYTEMSKVPLQAAPEVFQWAIIRGLYANNCHAYIMSVPSLPCFPNNYKKCYSLSGPFKFNGKCVGETVGFNTIIGLKPFSIKRSMVKVFSRWVETNLEQGEKLVVLVYAAPSYELEALKKVKQRYKNVEICQIVTDLVDDMMNFASNRSFLKRIQCGIEFRRMKCLYKHIDKFVLLSRYMEEKIPESVGKNIVVEGIYGEASIEKFERENRQNAILYTGTLEEFSGVRNLVDAFHKIQNDSIQLWICGSGFCSNYIASMAAIDGRIHFYGSVAREKVLELQKSAKVLINPRQPNGGITKYSFPSKTMEYMASGTPMIGYRLEGIPEEYFSRMFVVEHLTVEALSEKIKYVFSLSQGALDKMAVDAANFILENKSCEKQVKRILDFLADGRIG